MCMDCDKPTTAKSHNQQPKPSSKKYVHNNLHGDYVGSKHPFGEPKVRASFGARRPKSY